MTVRLARLEEACKVRRSPRPTDGRQMNVAVTAKGAAVRRSISDARRTWLAQVFAQLNAEDRKALLAAGKIARKLIEQRASARNTQIGKTP
jgi:DNA-binding MarR family transcriptional regulator